FEIFLKRNPEAKKAAKLIFLGGSNQRIIARAAGKEWLYVSEKQLDFEQVYEIQFQATVNIIIEAKAEISPFLPGKFPHCIQAKRPILLLGPEKSEAKRLLGADYPFWAEIDDLQKITNLIEELYLEWKHSEGKQEL